MLDRDHAPGGEALAVANAVHLVNNGHFGVAAKEEIGVQGMGRPPGGVDGPAGSDQGLTDHLPAEDALPADLRRAAAKQIYLELFEVEDAQEVLDR